nr:retrovirus-related Pol polyprotein from transposon TNT 1-94 [Tanacetum cinerariifolium]
VARNAEFLENSLINQEASGSLEDLEMIQEEDTSTRIRHAPDRMCLYIDAEEHELGDLGIDYEETFSPVADIRAIRILIAIAAYYDYEIWQMDVKTAFLNGYLNEEEKLKLSKLQGASTPDELKRMQNVPYASAVGSIMNLISQLGVVPIIEEPISMYCDNTGAPTIANESGITKGARHFRAKVHYLREVIEFGGIKLEKVHTRKLS